MSREVISELRYPLYLDSTMMVSFLAAIEDGVAFEESVQRKEGKQVAAAAEASGRFGFLTGFDFRAKATGTAGMDESEELQLVRRHTEASLFNKLRQILHSGQFIQSFPETGDDLDDLAPGQIIEVSGRVSRNALGELIEVFDRFEPLMKAFGGSFTQTGGAASSGTAKNKNSQNQQKRIDPSQDPMAFFKYIKEDLNSADMVDVLFHGQPAVACPIVLTLLQQYGTGRTIDSLLGSDVTVLGKVSAVIQKGSGINLTRRSVLGYMPEDLVENLFKTLDENPLFSDISDRIRVEPPLVQVLPMAIFI